MIVIHLYEDFIIKIYNSIDSFPSVEYIYEQYIYQFYKLMDQQVIEPYSLIRQRYIRFQADQFIEYDDKIKDLLGKGLQINEKIELAMFQLKNGLKYLGFAAKSQVGPNQILVRLPQSLILSSLKASQKDVLSEVFKDDFFSKTRENWEYRILAVYCVYLLVEKDYNNIWYQMTLKFSTQCNLAYFWSKQQLALVKDQVLIHMLDVKKRELANQQKQFLILRQKYSILQHQQFNLANYNRIYSNVINRCYGKYMSHTSLLPVLDLINHHSTKVNYQIQYQKNNGFTSSDEFQDDDSSEGSYDSQQSEYDYLNQNNQAEDISTNSKKQIQITPILLELKQQIQNLFLKTSKNFTFPFLFMMKEKLQNLISRLNEQENILQKISELRQIIAQFRSAAQKYASKSLHSSYYDKNKLTFQQLATTQKANKSKYESVIMQTSKFDRIYPNNQVFFRYGRDTNKSLLLGYGFAFEGNKYEYVSIIENISHLANPYPDLREKLKANEISTIIKFKIYRHLLNIDIITYYRLLSYKSLQKINQTFNIIDIQNQLQILKTVHSKISQIAKVYQSDKDLTDPSIGYSQYFIRVYNQQKYKILKLQSKMYEKLMTFLQHLRVGQCKEKALELFTKHELRIFKRYIQMIGQ